MTIKVTIKKGKKGKKINPNSPEYYLLVEREYHAFDDHQKETGQNRYEMHEWLKIKKIAEKIVNNIFNDMADRSVLGLAWEKLPDDKVNEIIHLWEEKTIQILASEALDTIPRMDLVVDVPAPYEVLSPENEVDQDDWPVGETRNIRFLGMTQAIKKEEDGYSSLSGKLQTKFNCKNCGTQINLLRTEYTDSIFGIFCNDQCQVQWQKKKSTQEAPGDLQDGDQDKGE